MDLVLDSDYLADLLAQYFNPECADYGNGRFRPLGYITGNLASRLNTIMRSSASGVFSLVIASTFAFVEISRKWAPIVKNRFTVPQMHSFIRQSPDWFSIAPVDSDLLKSFKCAPRMNSKFESIEWTDNIHMATVLSRGHNPSTATLVTNDLKLRTLLDDQGRKLF